MISNELILFQDFGFEDKLKLKNVIAGLNLQWKRNLCNGQIPITFASELTSFVHYSRCEHLQKCIDKFHHYFKNEVSADLSIIYIQYVEFLNGRSSREHLC